MASPEAGWYRDPTGRHTMRYWDGRAWSDNASSSGQAFVDVVDDVTRFVPPAPGTEVLQAPTEQAYAPMTQDVPRSSGMSVSAIVMSALAVIAVVILAVIVFTDDDDGDTSDQDTAPTVVVDEPTAESTDEATEDATEEETAEPTEAPTTPAP